MSGASAYYHADGNGNITYLMNNDQSLGASYKYDPYGTTLSSSGAMATANVYRFSSKEWLSNWGLSYYGYRFYSPSLQRWLTRDRLAERADINLYRFCINDPLDRWDSYGLAVGGCSYSWRYWKSIPGTTIPYDAGPITMADLIAQYLQQQAYTCSTYKKCKNTGDLNHCIFGCLLQMGGYGILAGGSEVFGYEWCDLWSDYVGVYYGQTANTLSDCVSKCKGYVCER